MDAGNILGLLPFAGFIWITFLSESMSCHCSLVISMPLAPVSFSSCNAVLVTVFVAAISASISFSCGMNGSVSSVSYFGCFHSTFLYL